MIINNTLNLIEEAKVFNVKGWNLDSNANRPSRASKALKYSEDKISQLRKQIPEGVKKYKGKFNNGMKEVGSELLKGAKNTATDVAVSYGNDIVNASKLVGKSFSDSFSRVTGLNTILDKFKKPDTNSGSVGDEELIKSTAKLVGTAIAPQYVVGGKVLYHGYQNAKNLKLGEAFKRGFSKEDIPASSAPVPEAPAKKVSDPVSEAPVPEAPAKKASAPVTTEAPAKKASAPVESKKEKHPKEIENDNHIKMFGEMLKQKKNQNPTAQLRIKKEFGVNVANTKHDLTREQREQARDSGLIGIDENTILTKTLTLISESKKRNLGRNIALGVGGASLLGYGAASAGLLGRDTETFVNGIPTAVSAGKTAFKLGQLNYDLTTPKETQNFIDRDIAGFHAIGKGAQAATKIADTTNQVLDNPNVQSGINLFQKGLKTLQN